MCPTTRRSNPGIQPGASRQWGNRRHWRERRRRRKDQFASVTGKPRPRCVVRQCGRDDRPGTEPVICPHLNRAPVDRSTNPCQVATIRGKRRVKATSHDNLRRRLSRSDGDANHFLDGVSHDRTINHRRNMVRIHRTPIRRPRWTVICATLAVMHQKLSGGPGRDIQEREIGPRQNQRRRRTARDGEGRRVRVDNLLAIG